MGKKRDNIPAVDAASNAPASGAKTGASQKQARGTTGERELKRGEKAEILRKLWAENPTASNSDIRRIFTERQGVDPGEANVSQAKPKELRRSRGGDAGDGPPSARSGNMQVPSAEPTITDLMRIGRLANEHKGGLAELRELVERVEKLGEEVGGIDRLKKCLNALAEIRGEK